jgi:hypothetical protein
MAGRQAGRLARQEEATAAGATAGLTDVISIPELQTNLAYNYFIHLYREK